MKNTSVRTIYHSFLILYSIISFPLEWNNLRKSGEMKLLHNAGKLSPKMNNSWKETMEKRGAFVHGLSSYKIISLTLNKHCEVTSNIFYKIIFTSYLHSRDTFSHFFMLRRYFMSLC